jgi:hypothetical protein
MPVRIKPLPDVPIRQARVLVQQWIEELRAITGHPLPGLPASVAHRLRPFAITTRRQMAELGGGSARQKLIKSIARSRFYVHAMASARNTHRVDLLTGEAAEPLSDKDRRYGRRVVRKMEGGSFYIKESVKKEKPPAPATAVKSPAPKIAAPPSKAKPPKKPTKAKPATTTLDTASASRGGGTTLRLALPAEKLTTIKARIASGPSPITTRGRTP